MNSEMNPRIASIAPSVTLGITAKAKAMKADGKEVFSFAAGEPDFDTPENIKKAAADALARGETKYSPASGAADLKAAIVAKLKNDNGLEYEASQIVVSNGAKHSLFNVIMAMCKEGDEVIIPAPYWLSYPEMVNIAGGKPVVLTCKEEDDYKMKPEALEAAITPKTKAIIINSPSNPIGIVYSEDELRTIADIAVKHGIYVISDEIYEKLVYEGAKHVSIGSFSDEILKLTVTVNGFSKAYSMTGWRLGYFAAPSEIVKCVNALQSHSTSGPNTFAQFGGVEALTGPQDAVEEMRAAFEARREYLYERLTAIDGITCVKPGGAFYVLPNISSFGLDSLSFADKLLDSKGVAVVPGVAFGADATVRMSYACSMDNIKGGVDRIEEFVASL
jgi:aspartate aminotransferase